MGYNTIQTKPRPHCPVCGKGGRILYPGLKDEVFEIPGLWNISKCTVSNCGTLWVDPMPEESDLQELYKKYYTHQSLPDSGFMNGLKTLHDKVESAYLHTKFGYEALSQRWKIKLLSLLLYLHPAYRDVIAAGVFYLPAKSGGSLLEIGCGGGDVLQSMQEKGWHVTGIDFDKNAVKNAKSKGLNVHCGQLSAQAFLNDSFDAVVMGHVIEHVAAPGDLLKECHRILKKGGMLVVLTPNANSSLHRRYGLYWRGLDAPRHLQIFTPESLSVLVQKSGFNLLKVFTAVNGFVYHDLASHQLLVGKKHVMGGGIALNRRIISHIRAFGLGWKRLIWKDFEGEEIVLVCKK